MSDGKGALPSSLLSLRLAMAAAKTAILAAELAVSAKSGHGGRCGIARVG